MINSFIFRAVVVSVALMASSCGGVSDDASSAEDADESVSVTSTESALTAELSDDLAQAQTTTGEQLAADAVKHVPARFTPSSCVTAVQSGATVTYTLTNCTGRFGLVSVSGIVVAKYSRVAGGAVQVLVTSTGLKANRATIDVNATVTVTQAGATKTASVVSSASGTGPRGITVTRNGTYSVTYDTTSECATVNGTWATTSGARQSSTTVSNYARCKGACPTGGTIVHETARGASVTVTY